MRENGLEILSTGPVANQENSVSQIQEKWPESYNDQRLEPARFWKVLEVTADMFTLASEFFPEDRVREPQNHGGRKAMGVQLGFPKWPWGCPSPDRSPKDKEGTGHLKVEASI